MKTLPCLYCGVLVLVVLAGSLGRAGAAAAQGPAVRGSDAAAQWRRTTDGWERADLWDLQPREHASSAEDDTTNTAPLPLPGVHPLAVASLMFAAAGLLAIGPGRAHS